MKLSLHRKWFSDSSTIGELFIDGTFECYVLEDVCRPSDEKVKGHTAIPEGQYLITINVSPRFGRRLPLLLNVPNFIGIRIHPGNTATDTEGCLLPGKHRGQDQVLQSRAAFEELFGKIEQALQRKEQVSISIVKAQAAGHTTR